MTAALLIIAIVLVFVAGMALGYLLSIIQHNRWLNTQIHEDKI